MAEDLADDLYGLPLEEFVPARDARARELRREKRRDEAAAVAKLAKPSRPAWIVNRLARDETALVAKLLECAEALEEAQQAALSGEGAQDLRSASRAERKAVDQLLAASRDLRPEGHKPSGAILERVRVTFQAAAADPELRERIRAGRVVEEPAGGGAWPFGGLPEGGAEKAPAAEPTKPRREKPAPSKRDRRPPSRRETEEEKEEKDDAGRAERERAAEREEQQRADEERAARRRELKGELTEARKAARNAARERERAQRDAERATERLERLAAEAAAAREAAESATARRDAAEEEADAAEAEVERIEDELRDR